MKFKARNNETRKILDLAKQNGLTRRLTAEKHENGHKILKIAVEDYNDLYTLGEIFAPAHPDVKVRHDHCTLTVFFESSVVEETEAA